MKQNAGCCLTLLLCVMGHGFAQSRVASAPRNCPDAGGTKSSGCDEQVTEMAGKTAPPAGLAFIGASLGIGGPVGLQEPTEIVKSEPYQAEAVTEMLQTLADGTHIRQSITAKVARDSQGRTVRSEKLNHRGPFLMFPMDGVTSFVRKQNQAPILTTIFDPVSGKHIFFTSDVRVAQVFPARVAFREEMEGAQHASSARGHAPDRSGRTHQELQGLQESQEHREKGVIGGAGGPDFSMGMPGGCDVCVEKSEPLGTKQIDGVRALGTRRTWTIPAGAIGNDRAIVTTEDTWYSPRLKLVLLSIRNDPRFGQTTYALKDLEFTNPPESLFQIPHGYKIEKLAPPPFPPPPGLPGPAGAR